MFNLKKKNFKKIDIILILAVLVLIAIGLVTLYSASLSLEYNPIKNQIFATIIGLGLMALVVLLDYDFTKSLYKTIYILSIILMLLVTFFGSGAEEWGADNWIVLGPISFQPSEFVKLGLIIVLAKFIEERESKINHPLELGKVLLLGLIPILMIAKEDFGTAIVVLLILAIILFTAGISWKYIGLVALIAALSLPTLYASLDDYQKDRIINFLDPSNDPTGTGLQATQGRIAVGSGQLFGKGFFKGSQTQNNYIPEKQTDFIFAVLGEEAGFVGVFIVIILYALVLVRLVWIARHAKDTYGTLLVMGICGMFFAHIFENIGMTIGLMPITGIPLPFMSHGGTFQIVNLLAIGLALQTNIERDRLDFS